MVSTYIFKLSKDLRLKSSLSKKTYRPGHSEGLAGYGMPFRFFLKHVHSAFFTVKIHPEIVILISPETAPFEPVKKTLHQKSPIPYQRRMEFPDSLAHIISMESLPIC
jgi:hypothetical protein